MNNDWPERPLAARRFGKPQRPARDRARDLFALDDEERREILEALAGGADGATPRVRAFLERWHPR